MTTLSPPLANFDPESPVALYEINGLYAVAFAYEGDFWLELLSPGDTVSNSLNGVIITPDPARGAATGWILTDAVIVRYLDADSHYDVFSKEDFQAIARFVDGPATLLRSALDAAQDQLRRAQDQAEGYKSALELIAYHLRMRRRLPHRTIFGATAAATHIVENTLGHPLDLTKPEKT